MRLEDIQKLPFKDKCSIVETIAREYNRALAVVEGMDKQVYTQLSDSKPTDPGAAKKREQINLVAIVNCVLNLLPDEQQKILKNDFFKPAETKWWYELYSKSQYYSIKNSALDNFTYYILI